jgi:lipoprotein-anchoring transpeptidase ErfK/SrfK
MSTARIDPKSSGWWNEGSQHSLSLANILRGAAMQSSPLVERRASLFPSAWPALFLVLATPPVFGAELTATAINAAEPSGKSSLSAEALTPLGVRLEVLLARADFSPGEIDGKFGENATKALRAYDETHHLQSSSGLTDDAWRELANDSAPVLERYTIAEKDISGPFLHKLPRGLEQMKNLPRLPYTGPRQALAEKFHMSEQLLAALNPGQRFDRVGTTIIVADTSGPNANHPTKAARVEVDKDRQTVRLFDRSNALIGFYPATVGSEEKPSPTGTLKVTAIDHNPTYRYDPKYHFKGVHSKKPFTIRPGPNNPVGTVWITLSPGEGYGIHGTPDPSKVSKTQSHGCVRLTNWDAESVANEVSKGTPVDFVDQPRSSSTFRPINPKL